VGGTVAFIPRGRAFRAAPSKEFTMRSETTHPRWSRPARVAAHAIAALTMAGVLGSWGAAGTLAATGQDLQAGPVHVLLAQGVVPSAGMSAYGTDNCTYRFDGAVWQPEQICRHFPDPRNGYVFDLYDRTTGEPLARLDLSEPGWVKERKASGPAADLWFKVPLNDLLTHGRVGPNNTFVLLGDGRWYKQLDLQEAAKLQRQRELMDRMTPEQAEQYAALQARWAEADHRMKMFALGAILVAR
jgi:hypothetical protein